MDGAEMVLVVLLLFYLNQIRVGAVKGKRESRRKLGHSRLVST